MTEIAHSGQTGLATRERAHTVLHEVLDRHRPLDEVLQTDKRFARLNDRDRAFEFGFEVAMVGGQGPRKRSKVVG